MKTYIIKLNFDYKEKWVKLSEKNNGTEKKLNEVSQPQKDINCMFFLTYSDPSF